MSSLSIRTIHRKAIWSGLALTAMFAVSVSAAPRKVTPGAPSHNVKNYKIDDELTRRTNTRNGNELVNAIVTLQPGAQLPPRFKRLTRGRALTAINGFAITAPLSIIKQLQSEPAVLKVNFDRPTRKHDYRSEVATGADLIAQQFGYTGKGVTIAVIDSGVTEFHDDLTSTDSTLYPYGDQRVVKFVDFVDPTNTLPRDDNGHGTHVSGIILGNGTDGTKQTGVAPEASLVSLRALDANGTGSISNTIAALSWVLDNYQTYNIRVVSMSVGAGITESYWTDPFTLAVKALVDRGVVVVAAAGNLGKNAQGQLQWGGITAPGNAPWTLTVGAFSTNGTLDTSDDSIASFSSSGPTAVDFAAKPDIVAPGVGIVSLADPRSTMYTNEAQFLVDGTINPGYRAYLSLSGTSQATPFVAGTVALMLQANPNLTPNLVKAILQYTANFQSGVSPLRQGAGYLNALGAVTLAKFYGDQTPGSRIHIDPTWSRHILWGNHFLTNGALDPTRNAWGLGVVWGSAKTQTFSGDNIIWGSTLLGDNIVWGGSALGDNIVWGDALIGGDNIIWGSSLTGDNIIWGASFDGDNIIWGSSITGDNIVWGSNCAGADCDDVIWGSSINAGDNIIWGSSVSPGDNIIWGSSIIGDNIIWGSSIFDDNIIWGSSSSDNTLWPGDVVVVK